MYCLSVRGAWLLVPPLLITGCLLGDRRARYEAARSAVAAEPASRPAPEPAERVPAEALGRATFAPSRALEVARRRNPELRAALEAWRAAVERAPQEAAWEDPWARVTYMARPIHTRAGPQRWKASISQNVPFPGKRGAQVDAALAAARAEAGRYWARLFELEEQVLAAWAELYRHERMLEVIAAELRVVEQIQEAVSRAFGAGRPETAAADAARARLRLTLLERKRVRHERKLRVARAAMNELLHRPPDASLPPTDPHPELPDVPADASEQALVRAALAARPEVAAAEAARRRGESLERAAWLEYLPDFQVGAQWTAIGSSSVGFRDAGRDSFGVTFGLELPLFVERRSAGVREARAGLRGAGAELAAVRDAVAREVVEARARVREADAAIELYGTAETQAESALEAARAAFRATGGDVTAVLEAEEDLEQTLHGRHMAVAEAIEARAALRRALGGADPDR